MVILLIEIFLQENLRIFLQPFHRVSVLKKVLKRFYFHFKSFSFHKFYTNTHNYKTDYIYTLSFYINMIECLKLHFLNPQIKLVGKRGN